MPAPISSEKKHLRAYFDDFYRQGDFDHYPEKTDTAFFRALFRFFDIQSGSLLLDAGCGSGIRLQRMKALGMEVLGVDFSLVGLTSCRSWDSETMLVQGDVLSLPFKSASIDGVIALGCSLVNSVKIDPIVEVIGELLRVAKPKKWVIATTTTDFSGRNINGWWQSTRSMFDQLGSVGLSADFRLLYTLPGLAKFFPFLCVNRFTSLIIQALPFYRRTAIMAWRKY